MIQSLPDCPNPPLSSSPPMSFALPGPESAPQCPFLGARALWTQTRPPAVTAQRQQVFDSPVAILTAPKLSNFVTPPVSSLHTSKLPPPTPWQPIAYAQLTEGLADVL